MISNLFVFLVIKVQYFLQLISPDFSCLSASIFHRPGFPQEFKLRIMIGRGENESGFVGITRFYWLR